MHFYISDLAEVGTMRNAEKSVGAKMARLGKVVAAGYAVPKGFVVDVGAYVDALADEAVSAAHEEAMNGIGAASTPGEFAAVRPRMRAAFDAYVFPEDLAEGLREALGALGEDLEVAVRSSAVGEDSSHASFAGQLETRLGIVGYEAMMAAIRSCWSSSYAAPALAYRANRGALGVAMPMAIGVLELVHPRTAGVAFSVHPVTRRRNRVVIEGNWGLGETVVSGRVSPDHVEVGKVDLRILDYKIGAKHIVSAFDRVAGCVTESTTPPEQAAAKCLTEEDVMAITAMTVEMEDLFGHPVDVEWAIAGTADGEVSPVVVLQVRPETVTEEPMALRTSYDPIQMIMERTSRKLSTGG